MNTVKLNEEEISRLETIELSLSKLTKMKMK